jgi:DNA gyrase inhibitor GyrI
MTAVTVAHLGSYMEINRAFDRLFGWLASRDLIGPDLRSFAIFHDDVATVPAAKLRSRAGVTRKIAVEAPVELTEIVGGDDAVLRHKGPYADMKAAFDWLYGAWLPQPGREPGDGPSLDRPRRVSQQPARHGADGTAVRYLCPWPELRERKSLDEDEEDWTDKLNSPIPHALKRLPRDIAGMKKGSLPWLRPSGSSTTSSARSPKAGA